MKKSKIQKPISRFRMNCFTAILIMIVTVLEMMLIYGLFSVTTSAVQLINLIILQPVIINLLLLILKQRDNADKAVSEENELSENKEEALETASDSKPEHKNFIKSILLKIRKFSAETFEKFRVHFVLKSKYYISGLIILTVTACNTAAWIFPIKNAVHKKEILFPVVYFVSFIVFMAVDIWCNTELKNKPEKDKADYIIFNNLTSIAYILKILFLSATIIEVLSFLEFIDLHKVFLMALRILFGCETAVLIYILAVRLLKNELYSNPDFSLSIRSHKNGDLNILNYLEENTGITMRSLWSITLIKKLIPGMLIFGIVILWLSSGIVEIKPNEKAALYRLGKLKKESLMPGIHMTLPWPFDVKQVYDTESLKEITVGYASDKPAGDNLWTEYHIEENKLLLGGGNELVSINLRIEYKIGNLNDYIKCSNSPESILESAAYEVVTANTISTDLKTLLDVDRKAFAKSFERDLIKRIEEYNTGLEVVNVIIESIHPPVEVSPVYQRIISAGIEAEKIILESQAVAEVSIEKAKKSYDTDVNIATAQSYTAIAEANASVDKFMASLKADKAYGNNYRYFKYIDSLRKAYNNSNLIILGEGIDSSHIYMGTIPIESDKKPNSKENK